MLVGIFGSDGDVQTQAFRREAAVLGGETLVVEAESLVRGEPVSFLEGHILYRGESLEDVHGWLLRFIPLPSVPALERDEALVLYEDWYTE